MKRKGFTLHFLVTTTVVLSLLVTLLVSSIVGFQSNKDALVSNTLELNRINAEKVAITTNDLLGSAKNTLAIAAGHLATKFLHDDNMQMLQLVKESNNIFNSVFIADNSGTVKITLPENLGVIGKKLESEAIQVALSQRRPLISEPYTGITGRYIILVSHPIFSADGQYLGLIGGSIYLNEPNVFEVLLSSPTFSPSGSYVYVVSKQGELLFHPNKNRIGEAVTANPVVQSVLKGDKGERTVINTVGDHMLAGYAPVHEVGWGVISQSPYENVNEASTRLVKQIFLYSAPILAILLIIVILLTRFISGPLYKLASFAEDITIDDYHGLKVPTIHNWNYEANELKKTIEKTVLSMQNRINVLSDEARKDTLTGLNNRRTMDRVLQEWLNRNLAYSYIILDIDHFKSVNDTYGHHMGDAVLQFLAAKMIELTGPDDVCCRFGGEEFVILSPGAAAEDAYKLAETIRENIASSPTPIGNTITISIGIAASSSLQDVEDTKQRADAALYASKQNGRNRSTIASAANK